MPALIASQELKIPWIANWSDPMPQQKSPPPYGAGPSAKIPALLQKYFEAVSRKASWHTFPCERLENYVCSYLPGCREKSSVISHPALERLCSHSEPSQEEFRLCHVGGLGLRRPDVFLDGVSRFIKSAGIQSSVSVQFVSREFDNIRELTKRFCLQDIVILREATTYEKTQQILEASAVLVVIEAACEEGIFFPSKFVDFVQTGRPILAVSPNKGTLHDILSTYGGGIAVDVASPDAVANAIRILYSEWKTGTLNEKYGTSRLVHLFSEKLVLKKYMGIFRSIKK